MTQGHNMDAAKQLAEKLTREFAIGNFETATCDDFEEASVDEVAEKIRQALDGLGLELRQQA